MVGEDATLTTAKILERLLRLAIELARLSKRTKTEHPKTKIGEKDLKKLTKQGEDMVPIPESLNDEELNRFRQLAKDFGILYSVVDANGENVLFVRKDDLDKTKVCLDKIFKSMALEQAKEEALANGYTEEEWKQAQSLFDANELHALNQKGLTFEDALDHITDRDYSSNNVYYLFDRNNPDLHIKMKSERATDHNNKEYTKTTYSVYHKDQLIGQVDDGRFPGREKSHWFNLKSDMKHTFHKEGIPDFSDNVFILHSEKDLNHFRDTYNKQLSVILENEKKRLSQEEITELQDKLNEYVIPLLESSDPNTKEDLENCLNQISEKQEEINQLKLEAFEYVGEKGPKESKEEYRDRMENLNNIQDSVKETERELADLYNQKDSLLSKIEDLFGKNLENEAYTNMLDQFKNYIGENQISENSQGEHSEVVKSIIIPKHLANQLNTMLEAEGKKTESYHEKEDGMVSLNTDSLVDETRFNELHSTLEKIVENESLKDLECVLQKEIPEDKAKSIIDSYGSHICEQMKHSNIGQAIEQTTGRICFCDKSVTLTDPNNENNYVKINTTENRQTEQPESSYVISIDGEVFETDNMQEAIERAGNSIGEFEIEMEENEIAQSEIVQSQENSDHSGQQEEHEQPDFELER